MKTTYRILLPLLFVALLISSCSQDNPVSEAQKATLGFTSLLNDFIEGGRLTDELPQCSSNEPMTVCVGIKDANGNWVLDQTPLLDNDGLGPGDDYIIEVQVAPASANDIDNDGDYDTWFTEESESLELPEGDYTIEYFMVKDENGDAIYAAPLESADYGDVQYQNFVNDALPIELTLYAGTKKYVDVEVLCFEEHYAQAYGYLFFDISEIEQQHICIFGNVCDEFGRHYPAHFRAIIWEHDPNAGDSKGDLLFDGENEYGTNAAGEEYASPLCIPLPDRENVIEEFFAEIYLIDGGSETLIRSGVFDETDVKALYINQDSSYYWHFREGCEECDDEPTLLDGCEPVIPDPALECIAEYLETIEELGISINEGNNPPNIEGIFHFDALTLINSNIAGDSPGQTFSDVKIRLSNQTPVASGASIDYERKTFGSGTVIPQEAYVSGSGNDFSLFACATIVNSSQTDSIRLAYLFSGTLGANGMEDVSYVLLNVDDFGDPNGTFIGEGEGRYIDEADGEATEVFDFNLRQSFNGRAAVDPAMKE